MVLKSRPVVTMAGMDQMFGGQDGRVLRLGLWEILTIKLRGIEPGQVLITKNIIGWADGVKITSRRYYGRRKPNFERGRDARVVKAGALGDTHD